MIARTGWRGAIAAAALTLLGATPVVLGPCHAIDGFVDIPVGSLPLGEDGVGAPGTATEVAAFAVGRHEVTNRQFAAFVLTTGYRTAAEREGAAPVFVMPNHPVALDDPRGWWRMVKGADWRHPQGPTSTIDGHADEPVVQVSYDDAVAFAHWAGGELPTATQWERAARGGQLRGADPESWRRDRAGRLIANTWQGVFPIIDTAEDGHAGLAPIGCFDANAFGLVDMIGNAWEWTSEPAGPGQRLLKGGSFLCASNYCSNYRPAAWQAQEHDLGASHIGFRIVRRGGS